LYADFTTTNEDETTTIIMEKNSKSQGWFEHFIVPMQCFSTGVLQNLRVPRVAARGPAKTDRNCLG